MRAKKKQIIWTSDDYFNDEAREEYATSQRDLLGDYNYEVSDREWYETVDINLDDERSNLNKEVDGVIIAFGDIGTWRGRRQGYKIVGNKISDILKSSCEYNEWWGDTYNIKGKMTHHDGTNYVLYRVAKNRDEAERIGILIYNGEIDEEGFRRRTRSLYPYVAAVYGWKVRSRQYA